MNMTAPTLIIFDLDGTLVDSAPDLTFALNGMLKKLGLSPVTDDQVRCWTGNGVAMLVKRALTGQMQPAADPPLFDQAYPLFEELYANHVSDRSRLFPGVKEGLQALKDKGYKLACITNKHAQFTHPLLQNLGIFDLFDFIGCGDQFEKLKPHPMPLLKTAEFLGIEPARAIMVGDSINDVQAARAAGLPIVCVPYGYTNGQPVEALNPDGIIHSIADLPALLERTT